MASSANDSIIQLVFLETYFSICKSFMDSPHSNSIKIHSQGLSLTTLIMFTASSKILSETGFFFLPLYGNEDYMSIRMTVHFGVLIGSREPKVLPFLLHNW